MTVTYTEIPETAMAELTVEGKVTREDFDRVAGPLDRFIETHGTIRLLEKISSFEGFDPSLLLDGVAFDIKHIKHISHCAVVSDIGWMSPLAKAAGAFISTKLRTFPLAELDAARAWLKNPE